MLLDGTKPVSLNDSWHNPGLLCGCLPKKTADLITNYCNNSNRPKLNSTIYVKTRGRLGNNLCEIAGSYIFSQLFGVRVMYIWNTVTLPAVFPHIDESFIKENDRINTYLNTLPRIDQRIIASEEIGKFLIKYLTTGDVYLHTYMDVPGEYVNGSARGACKNHILQLFTFNKYLRLKAKQFLTSVSVLSKFLTPNLSRVVKVGLHIRRGDFLESDVMKANGIEVPNITYFTKAMDWFNANFENPVFIATSDDRQWCNEQLIDKGVFLTGNDNSAEQDMATISSCDHVITSLGTYSFWSGYLADGIVVKPTRRKVAYSLQMKPNPSTNIIEITYQ